jgi:hypothetical protein
MPTVTIMCSRTGDFVSTGIEMDPDAFAALPTTLSRIRCPACGSEHVWSKATAWLSGFGQPSPVHRLAERDSKPKPHNPLERLLKLIGEPS